MTKVYKIKPIENPSLVNPLIASKINEIIGVVNSLALSDKEELKQEEWKGCGICNCKYPQFCEGCYKADYKCRVCDNEPKQPTSLKEEIIETIWMAHGQSAVVPNTSDKILSLIQSHLVKEIENLTQETVLDDLKREFPVLYKQDIIKIINNINI